LRHIREHLTYANVISTLCLFLLLGGGTAVALNGSNTVFSDDIVDNQVKSADVRNDTLTGGGLGAADLKPGSVGTSEVANNSLNGSDINESGLGIVANANQLDGIDSTGFLSSGSVKKLIFEDAASDTLTDIATVGPYTIKGECEHVSGPAVTNLVLWVNGPAGTVDLMAHFATNDAAHSHTSGVGGQGSIPASTDYVILSTATNGIPQTRRMAGTAMLKTGSDVVQVDFNGVADNPDGSGGENCYLYGTATMGT
jgi:hypothetical protein